MVLLSCQVGGRDNGLPRVFSLRLNPAGLFVPLVGFGSVLLSFVFFFSFDEFPGFRLPICGSQISGT